MPSPVSCLTISSPASTKAEPTKPAPIPGASEAAGPAKIGTAAALTGIP